jgi:hypothetical protein
VVLPIQTHKPLNLPYHLQTTTTVWVHGLVWICNAICKLAYLVLQNPNNKPHAFLNLQYHLQTTSCYFKLMQYHLQTTAFGIASSKTHKHVRPGQLWIVNTLCKLPNLVQIKNTKHVHRHQFFKLAIPLGNYHMWYHFKNNRHLWPQQFLNLQHLWQTTRFGITNSKTQQL